MDESTANGSERQGGSGDRLVVEREIDAPAARVFGILADPASHPGADGWGMVQGPADPEQKLGGVGDTFRMKMRNDRFGDYEMDNEVVAFDPPREIAWRPRPAGSAAEDAPGWTWTWQLEESSPSTTRARLVYDWSAVSADDRAKLGGFPPVPRERFERSLEMLAETVEGARPGGMQSILAPGAVPGDDGDAAARLGGDAAHPHGVRQHEVPESGAGVPDGEGLQR